MAKRAEDLQLKSEQQEREIERLEEKIEELEGEIADLEEQAEASTDEFLHEQLDTLAVDPPTATPEQLTRLYNGILRGEDWRHGTWR